MARAPVRLNVYDMYWLNEYASTVGFGVYHSGIEVYGVEYAYGGHPFAFSGVFENTPQDAEELGENFKFRESILIGETDFSATDVRHMIQLFGHEYRGDKYHLISKNCNHFSAAFAKTLTGRDIPGWVNRLASFSGSIPFLEKCLPQEWLTPAALKQTIEERRRSNEFSSIDSAEEIHEESSLNRRSSLPCNGRSQESREKNGAIAASRLASKYTCSASPPSSSTSKSSTTINSTSLSSSRNTSSSATTLNQVPSFSRLWNSIKNITQSDSVNTQNDSSQLNSHSHKQ